MKGVACRAKSTENYHLTLQFQPTLWSTLVSFSSLFWFFATRKCTVLVQSHGSQQSRFQQQQQLFSVEKLPSSCCLLLAKRQTTDSQSIHIQHINVAFTDWSAFGSQTKCSFSPWNKRTKALLSCALWIKSNLSGPHLSNPHFSLSRPGQKLDACYNIVIEPNYTVSCLFLKHFFFKTTPQKLQGDSYVCLLGPDFAGWAIKKKKSGSTIGHPISP